MNKGQEILHLQNEDSKIDMLLAQRRLYSSAKTLRNIIFIAFIFIPIIIALLDRFDCIKTDDNSIFIFYGIVGVVLEIILQKQIEKKTNLAASIQEKFDTSVFKISENNVLTSDVDGGIIRKYSIKDKQDSKKVEKVQNWYSEKINVLHTNLAVIFCQRMNITYDQNIKSEYKKFLCILSVSVGIIIFLLSLESNYSFKILSEKVLLPLLPIFKFVYDEVERINNSVNNLKRLREKIENILKSLTTKSDTIEEKELRTIQDMIFYNRTHSPFVPDCIYKYFRERSEDEMNYSVEEKIKELKA